MAVITRDPDRGRRIARLRAMSWSLAIVPLTVVCVGLATVFAAQELYADRALPGVAVAGVDVGSLTRQATAERLQNELARPWAQSTIVATSEGRSWTTTNGALGVRPDVVAAADAALRYGKTGSLIDHLGAWAGALRGEARVPLTLQAEGDALDRWLTQITTDVDRTAVSGSIVAGPNGLAVTNPIVGRQLDRNATAASVLAAQTLADREITLSVRAVYPAVDESGFRDALARAQAVTTPLSVTVEDRRVTEDAAGLGSLLQIERVVAKPGELDPIPAGAIAAPVRYRYIVSLDVARVTEWVKALGAKLDRPAVSARYTVSKESTLGVVPGVAGILLEQDKMKGILLDELLKPAGVARELVAPSAADTTAFTTQQAQEWLPKLVRSSTFTTNFPVSQSRHANIATGSAQFDGVVIMPGQTFSFWALIGPVTAERGYAYAGAIINNRSDENVIGGGLCQVSTTMFNAVSRLGYEIVERHAHGYLIERYPLGLDAAVFDPGVDFRWKNDTASPVFLWSWVSDTSVTFDVWGLPTDRTVTFSDPLQRNFVDVPADQPADPAFPAGYAIRGRDVMRIRTVMEGGKVLHQDTLWSHYAPVWGGPAPVGTVAIVR
ncbi:MAG: VanW family protein [Candidatus Limnocylindria bacterium]|nr:VanW family protein [Candidatus Limnocylindria bacterium]